MQLRPAPRRPPLTHQSRRGSSTVFSSPLARAVAVEGILRNPLQTVNAATQGAQGHLTCHSPRRDRKSTRLNSSHGYISYAVFCLKKKKKNTLYPNKQPIPEVFFNPRASHSVSGHLNNILEWKTEARIDIVVVPPEEGHRQCIGTP